MSVTLAKAAQLMWADDLNVFLLNEHGGWRECFTDRDLCMVFFFQGVTISEIKVSALMSRQLFDCSLG
jgi:hypothetical protein